jgi:hypothetical protein
VATVPFAAHIDELPHRVDLLIPDVLPVRLLGQFVEHNADIRLTLTRPRAAVSDGSFMAEIRHPRASDDRLVTLQSSHLRSVQLRQAMACGSTPP